jgi:hypothetical protein
LVPNYMCYRSVTLHSRHSRFLPHRSCAPSAPRCPRLADLVVIAGNPATRISDVRNVQIVFKQGIGYESAKLVESVRGKVGLF